MQRGAHRALRTPRASGWLSESVRSSVRFSLRLAALKTRRSRRSFLALPLEQPRMSSLTDIGSCSPRLSGQPSFLPWIDRRARSFDCGSEAQTNWLRRHALQAQAAETSAVYVVSLARSRRVVGYFALAAGSVERSKAPRRVTKGAGRHHIPVILLARLGVDLGEQRRGLGTALMKEVLLRTSEAADTVGARALLIHAEP